MSASPTACKKATGTAERQTTLWYQLVAFLVAFLVACLKGSWIVLVPQARIDNKTAADEGDGLYCKVTVLPTVMRCPNHQLQSALVSALHPYKALALAC